MGCRDGRALRRDLGLHVRTGRARPCGGLPGRAGGRRPSAGVRDRHGTRRHPAGRARRPGERDRAVAADGRPAPREAARHPGRGRGHGDQHRAGASSRSCTSSGTASGTCAPRTSRSRASATRRATSCRAGGSSIELWVPGIRRFPPGQAAVPFHVGRQPRRLRHLRHGHPAGHVPPLPADRRRQRDATAPATSATSGPPSATSWRSSPGWSSSSRVADWHGTPFTTDSESHVSVWRKPG